MEDHPITGKPRVSYDHLAPPAGLLDEFGLPMDANRDVQLSWDTRYRVDTARIDTNYEFGSPPVEIDLTQLSPVDDAEQCATLRVKRRPRDFHASGEADALNAKIVDLVLDPESDDSLLLALLTPDDREVSLLGMKLLESGVHSHDQIDGFNRRLNRLHQQKVDAFEAGMQERGLDASVPDEKMVLDQIRETVADPESALAVPAEFWTSYQAMPIALKSEFLLANMPLHQAAKVASMIDRYGLGKYTYEVKDTFFALDEPARERYANSLVRALDSVDSSERISLAKKLSHFEDPSEAVRLAHAMGTDDFEMVRVVLGGSPLYYNRDLVAAPPEIVDVLVSALPYLPKGDDVEPEYDLSAIRDALSKHESPSEYAPELLAALAEFPEGAPAGVIEVQKGQALWPK